MAYRDRGFEHEKKTAEPGIVADMVRQFADKHAFLRELVQNGIDAGATRIEARIDRDDAGVVRTSVTDDGCGMTRATIEGPLLTLFSSSKEGDRSKIGKYGIGFVSVFALEPDHVEVRTRAGAEAWTVRLFGDHTWELSEDGGRERGTTVMLVQRMEPEVFAAHVEAAERALRRWCRHARVPIALTVTDGASPRAVAIDEPFDAPGLVAVRWEEGDERIVVAAGGPEPCTATYFSRGLTLHETDAPPELLGVRFKIDSPALSHTLSRDDVVRDASQRRLLARAQKMARGPLADALVARIAEAAAAAEAPADYVPFLEALVMPAFARRRREVVVPLTDPIRGARTIASGALGDRQVLVAAEPSAITHALARRGHPVVRWVEVAPLLRVFTGEVHDVALAIARAAPIATPHPEDAALERAMLRLLGALDRRAAKVWIASFEGALAQQSMRVVAEAEREESVVAVAVAEKRAWGKGARVYLNVEDPAVRLARRRAKTEPAIAAHLLCRALLVAEGPLPSKLVDRLLEAALE
ncbi:MAG: ATP-binding protein [Labilithrix sp.]|nr:ATP-binding protein [Labilithrix sp.]MCW5813723.1 ATP-binding protein [Labilithrix sp.]